MSEIKYRTAESKDEQNVLQLLRDHFYPYEPFNNDIHDKEDEIFAIGSIKHGLCTIAEIVDASHPDGYIVGCRLAYIQALSTKWKRNLKSSQPPHTKRL